MSTLGHKGQGDLTGRGLLDYFPTDREPDLTDD
jgi:hypothetical protein